MGKGRKLVHPLLLFFLDTMACPKMSYDTRFSYDEKSENILKQLYKNGSLYYDTEKLASRSGEDREEVDKDLEGLNSAISSPFPVIDPRFLGYQFPSYTFIETENNLEDALKAKPNHFDRPEDSLFLGTVLGDYDLIHRRVDQTRWENASFAKWAKERLSYFEEFETYSIFQIARWYGKDRKNPIESESDIRELDEVETDIIQTLNENSEFLKKVEQEEELELDDIPAELDKYDEFLVRDRIQNLKEDEILLGSSITYDINDSPWKSVIMGISVGQTEDTEDGGPRMSLSVDHHSVIEDLQSLETEYINKFTMPFITSGIGQSWADILLELRVKNVHQMDAIAQDIREIPFVATTQTYMLTDVIMNSSPDI